MRAGEADQAKEGVGHAHRSLAEHTAATEPGALDLGIRINNHRRAARAKGLTGHDAAPEFVGRPYKGYKADDEHYGVFRRDAARLERQLALFRSFDHFLGQLAEGSIVFIIG